jgi:hypothetical protein
VRKSIFAAIVIVAALPTLGESPSLKTLYDQHRWFDLRDAIHGKSAPPLYQGAVASAFNDPKPAEKYLNEAIQSEPHSENAQDAHKILAKLYGRAGMYTGAVRQLDAVLANAPESADVRGTRAVFAAWSKHPDQSIASAKSSTFRADVEKDGVKLPVRIHGKTVRWLMDTGFDFSGISESEAKSLGVAVDESQSTMGDSAGGTASIRTAVVDDLAIGDAHLRHVAFLVLPDDREPMAGWPQGERGIIGLPVLLALQSLRWQSDGTFEIGSAAPKSVAPNLCLDGFGAVLRVTYGREPLDFSVDTGDQAGTQLWPRFAHDFPALLREHGTKSSQSVEQVGGANQRETVSLPEIVLRVGGMDVTLRPAHVYAKPVGDDFHHGLLGMDV